MPTKPKTAAQISLKEAGKKRRAQMIRQGAKSYAELRSKNEQPRLEYRSTGEER